MKIEKGHYVPKELITSEAIHEAVVKCFAAAGFYRKKSRGIYPCEDSELIGLSIVSDGSVCWGIAGRSAKKPLTLQQLFTAENGLKWPDWAECIYTNLNAVWFHGRLNYGLIAGDFGDGVVIRTLATRQPKEKEVNEALDKAVIELNGVWSVDGGNADYLRIEKNLLFSEKPGDKQYICTYPEFTQRAKELGFINGYRWGVEYQTNGKRPDLADDVMVLVKNHSKESDAFGSDPVKTFLWEHVSSFKITDQRYKPADTSYLQTPAVEAVEEVAQVDWWDYDKCEPISYNLPSVGERVLLDEYECIVLAKDGNAVWLKNVITNKKHSVERNNVLKPLDHATRKAKAKAKAKAEKKRVVDAAMVVYHKVNWICSKSFAEALYDAGLLRLPAEGEEK